MAGGIGGMVERRHKLGQPLPEEVRRVLGPYFPTYDLSRVQVQEGIPWYVRMNPDAYTDWQTIYFAPGKYDPHSAAGIALIGHELMHCLQYAQRGKWRFRFAYLGCWLQQLARHRRLDQAYWLNPFEVEARAIERRIRFDVSRLVATDGSGDGASIWAFEVATKRDLPHEQDVRGSNRIST